MRLLVVKCKPEQKWQDRTKEALQAREVWIGWFNRNLERLANVLLRSDELEARIKALGYGWSAARSIATFISKESDEGVVVVPTGRGRKRMYFVAMVKGQPRGVRPVWAKSRLFGRRVEWLNPKHPWPANSAPTAVRNLFREQMTCRKVNPSYSVDRWLSGVITRQKYLRTQEKDAALTAQEAHGSGGYQPDSRTKKAIERHAMKKTRAYLEAKGYSEIRDTSADNPYDFECQRRKEIMYIEVKGTTGDGCNVVITAGENRHLRRHKYDALVVIVRRIRVKRGKLPKAGGGELKIWTADQFIARGEFNPTQFTVALPC